VNHFLEGESIFISDHNQLQLFDEDRPVLRFGLLCEDDYGESAVTFASHSRVVATTHPSGVRIFDLRKSSPGDESISISIPNASSLLDIGYWILTIDY